MAAGVVDGGQEGGVKGVKLGRCDGGMVGKGHRMRQPARVGNTAAWLRQRGHPPPLARKLLRALPRQQHLHLTALPHLQRNHHVLFTAIDLSTFK